MQIPVLIAEFKMIFIDLIGKRYRYIKIIYSYTLLKSVIITLAQNLMDLKTKIV